MTTKKEENKKVDVDAVPLPSEIGLDHIRPQDCKTLTLRTNTILEEVAKSKANTLSHCHDNSKGCGCDVHRSVLLEEIKTDLIVLIDTSVSMDLTVKKVSEAVDTAIDAARSSCDPNLKITYLGVNGTWPDTVFDQSHSDYIINIQNKTSITVDKTPSEWTTDKGARAIEDLSNYAEWREGACRAIFYISDEELDGVSPRGDFSNETAKTDAAIAAANANNVTVFAHLITQQDLAPQILQNYEDLCSETGGEFYSNDFPNTEKYIELLSKVICNSCGSSDCKVIDLPDVNPCISIKWGDSDCDCLESSDYEVMTLTVCNCYSNIAFSNFNIASIEVIGREGHPIPKLPNDKPSIQVHPLGVYCFGDIAPCSCVTREFVVLNEGAKAGEYKISLKGICYDIIKSVQTEDCFTFKICKD